MTTYIELFLEQGSNFSANVVITDPVTNAAMNIANATFSGNIKDSYYSTNVAATWVCNKADVGNGILNISLGRNVLANLNPQKYVTNIKMTANNDTRRVFEGPVFVSPDA